ncbi:hypothetical protein OH77DRAFT_1593825, partial [Trametes cingulata]
MVLLLLPYVPPPSYCCFLLCFPSSPLFPSATFVALAVASPSPSTSPTTPTPPRLPSLLAGPGATPCKSGSPTTSTYPRVSSSTTIWPAIAVAPLPAPSYPEGSRARSTGQASAENANTSKPGLSPRTGLSCRSPVLHSRRSNSEPCKLRTRGRAVGRLPGIVNTSS